MNTLTNFDTQTMSSREIAELCGKEHRNVCRDIESLNETYEKMGLLKIEQGYYKHQNTGSQQHREFLLNKEQTIDLVTGYKPELRIKINRRWAELEEVVKQNAILLPNFSNPAEAARAWAIEYEAKQIAEQERDHAIATKAEISDRKTATAMATASAKSRQAEALKEQLGESKKYASVKAVENKTGGKYNWRNLKKWCLEKGREIKDIADPNFGTVKIYPKEAWEEVYGIELKRIFG
ncbi:Rha family transcriptional regulator [Acinetobacter bereziniae]|uniref:Rha family transcriptional regulator n=1 Tax=Acinetobacter bereziniae TaxID=106648 RepID=UPI0020751FB5|nr:Rha family transcriptional regulator [Acinetobacter bereziniae]MCM8510915.1 Rha family transcriptional regulator [Acinetobacter bereziniae]